MICNTWAFGKSRVQKMGEQLYIRFGVLIVINRLQVFFLNRLVFMKTIWSFVMLRFYSIPVVMVMNVNDLLSSIVQFLDRLKGCWPSWLKTMVGNGTLFFACVSRWWGTEKYIINLWVPLFCVIQNCSLKIRDYQNSVSQLRCNLRIFFETKVLVEMLQ